MSARVIVFDVNETLSDMAPLAERFIEVGAPAHLLSVWFAALLRDGFALTAIGQTRTFSELGFETLRGVLYGVLPPEDVDAAASRVMSGFAELSLHPDVVPGVRVLSDAAVRLATLSNGASRVADQLLRNAGIRSLFERVLSVEDAGIWKPAPAAYHYAAAKLGVEPAELLMVAVHPWDLHGAHHAGLQTAWINRDARPYPAALHRPDHIVESVSSLARVAI